MFYNSICNDTLERARSTYSHVWWDNGFSEFELNRIDEICSKEFLENALTVGMKNEDIEKIREHRDSKLKFIGRNDVTSWIFDRFNFIGQSLNERFYGFQLYGYNNFQYTVYEPNGKYDWHMDTIMNDCNISFTRKLSLVLLLNEPGKDFTGGEFHLNIGLEKNPIITEFPRGRILAFPSFMIHKVAPIISGIRKSIVIWIEGPKFV